MTERARKKKKHLYISEDDIATVLERYSATTLLALLKEISRFPDGKLDWKELVKNTQTGISNAREYQMLWRHLAYRQTLFDKLEDGAEPLDDDSDLEYELAAFPPISLEATAEAATCVRVMMESGLSDSGHPRCSMVEAPLTVNIPNGHSSRAPFKNSKTPCSVQGINIMVPVCVQKQPVPGVISNEGLDTNGTGGNMPPRKKRKPWTEAEDIELVAAVQKFGEGNWANIVKGDFMGGRTASQLSQRWAIIRKKNGNMNVGGGNPSPGPQLSEGQLAACNNAMNLALNLPAKNIISPSSVGRATGTGLNGAPNNSACPPIAEANSLVQAVHQSEQAMTSSSTISSKTVRSNATANGFGKATHQSHQGLNATCVNSLHPSNIEVGSVVQAAHQSQQDPNPSKSSPVGALSLSAKSRAIAKKPSTKSVYNSDSMVKATAVAAGARIATKSVADSVIKAAKNVHIMPTSGVSLMKSAMSSGATTHLAGHPNVHYICTGLAATSHPTYPVRSASTRPAPPTTQRTSSVAATSPKIMSKQTNAMSSSLTAETTANQHVKSGKEIKVLEMDNAPKGQVQKGGACVAGDAPSNQVEEDKATLSNHAAGLEAEVSQDANQIKNKDEESQDANQRKNKAEENQHANQNNNKDGDQSREANKESGKAEDQSQEANKSSEMGGSQINNAGSGGESSTETCKNELPPPRPSMATDGAIEKLKVVCKAAVGNEV